MGKSYNRFGNPDMVQALEMRIMGVEKLITVAKNALANPATQSKLAKLPDLPMRDELLEPKFVDRLVKEMPFAKESIPILYTIVDPNQPREDFEANFRYTVRLVNLMETRLRLFITMMSFCSSDESMKPGYMRKLHALSGELEKLLVPLYEIINSFSDFLGTDIKSSGSVDLDSMSEDPWSGFPMSSLSVSRPPHFTISEFPMYDSFDDKDGGGIALRNGTEHGDDNSSNAIIATIVSVYPGCRRLYVVNTNPDDDSPSNATVDCKPEFWKAAFGSEPEFWKVTVGSEAESSNASPSFEAGSSNSTSATDPDIDPVHTKQDNGNPSKAAVDINDVSTRRFRAFFRRR
jgi:hypothetical protein